MSDEKKEDCEGMRQARETDKEIKAIHKLIATICTNSEVNKTNLEHVTEAYKELATANSLTHYKLFSRTENLKIGLKAIETKHGEHVKHGTVDTKNKQYRYTMLVSLLAIGVSVATAIILAVQAGLFN